MCSCGGEALYIKKFHLKYMAFLCEVMASSQLWSSFARFNYQPHSNLKVVTLRFGTGSFLLSLIDILSQVTLNCLQFTSSKLSKFPYISCRLYGTNKPCSLPTCSVHPFMLQLSPLQSNSCFWHNCKCAIKVKREGYYFLWDL